MINVSIGKLTIDCNRKFVIGIFNVFRILLVQRSSQLFKIHTVAHVARTVEFVNVEVPPRTFPGFTNVPVLQQLPAMSQISSSASACVLI